MSENQEKKKWALHTALCKDLQRDSESQPFDKSLKALRESQMAKHTKYKTGHCDKRPILKSMRLEKGPFSDTSKAGKALFQGFLHNKD